MNNQSILHCCRLLLVVFLLAVSHHAKAQEDGKITLLLGDTTLKTAIRSIEAQSPYLFIDSGIDLDKKINVSVENQTIENICRAVFTPAGISYKIRGHNITLSEIVPVTVSGVVCDALGQPVPGVAVLEKGTANGVMTDADGKYT